MPLKLDAQGLIPAVVQDANTHEVLMVAWMNAEALQRTRDTGEAHFWSRSRQELWHKGATSGNTQSVREIRVDCDEDTLLLLVDPAGPACHTGERTCFYRDLEEVERELATRHTQHARLHTQFPKERTLTHPDPISTLWTILEQRRDNPSPDSYTARLLRAGDDEIAKKVGEEAIEVILAAKAQGRERLVEESADLVYHLLVLLLAKGLTWEDVLKELAARGATGAGQ